MRVELDGQHDRDAPHLEAFTDVGSDGERIDEGPETAA
jgi:hypothetical protein